MDKNDDTSSPSQSRGLDKASRTATPDSKYTSVADVELTTDHLTFFKEAGASEIFLKLVQVNPMDAGVHRNSTQEEAKKYVYLGYLEGDPGEFSHEGGFFFTEMWAGNLYEAFCKADINNSILLKEVFGENSINNDRESPDSPKISELSSDRFFL
jgi:hypothetical protein